MVAWIDALGAHVQANGLGTLGTDLFTEPMPEDDTSGPTTCLVMEPGQSYLVGGNRIVDRPGLLLGVRGADWNAAYTQVNAVRDLLRVVANQTVQGVTFLGVTAQDTVTSVGRDERKRIQFTARFEVVI